MNNIYKIDNSNIKVLVFETNYLNDESIVQIKTWQEMRRRYTHKEG